MRRGTETPENIILWVNTQPSVREPSLSYLVGRRGRGRRERERGGEERERERERGGEEMGEGKRGREMERGGGKLYYWCARDSEGGCVYVEGVNRKSRILFSFQLLLIDDNEMRLVSRSLRRRIRPANIYMYMYMDIYSYIHAH